jgi:dTDP-4-dehydrorhamnose reductase
MIGGMNNMQVVIVGAKGIIGNALFKAFSPLFPGCVGLTTQSAPSLSTITYDAPSILRFAAKADVVVYCVGVSKFAECEQSPAKSLFLNAELPEAILRQLSPQQTFVYFSSPVALHDFGDKPAPRYARHKREAERRMESVGHARTLVIRPAKVIESTVVLRDWKTALAAGKSVSAFSDQYIAPVSTGLLSEQLIKLLQGGHYGDFNFSARDRMSYVQLAQALCRHCNFDAHLIQQKSARENNPFFFTQDVLDCTRAEQSTGYIPPVACDIVFDYFGRLA